MQKEFMKGRAIWKGYIHFRDVDVPVKLHSAIKENRVQFHLLHKHDRVRLKQQMICAYEKLPVSAEEQTRGFELEEGKYILIDAEELEQTEPGSSRIIEVHEFVKSDQIDSLFLDRVYYLEQDMPSSWYNELVQAIRDMSVLGVCTWTMRKRSYLGVLGVGGKILRLTSLRYADEVMHMKSLPYQSIPLTDKEIKIGSDLIRQLAGPFEPEKFENEHQKRLQNLIDMKIRGEKVTILPPKWLKPTAPDKLLEALEASLKKTA